ncbi:MAG TPA: RNA polymerase sigma-70 factor [Hanamia sp.]|jgi:RNA polymerase sigma-70 factor (ECF subfamily)|nr:RNA polymerase sigma-70 factor [Hanamia sp.]
MAKNNFHTEKELLEQISAGDEKAFRALFATYYEQLYRYIFGFIKSKQVSEELVMDVFLKIWLGRDLIPQIEKFDAFLFRVAHNKSIDFLRSVARDPKFKDLLLENIQLANNVQSDSPVLMQEFETKLREAVSLLSPQRKKVFQLSREQDMTHDEIAAQLNLSKHTINNHIVEAQRFIRTYLSKNFDIAFVVAILPTVMK